MAEFKIQSTCIYNNVEGFEDFTATGDFSYMLEYGEPTAIAFAKDNIGEESPQTPVLHVSLKGSERDLPTLERDIYSSIVTVSTFDTIFDTLSSNLESIYEDRLSELKSVLSTSISLHNWAVCGESTTWLYGTPSATPYINWLGGSFIVDKGSYNHVRSSGWDMNFAPTLTINGLENNALAPAISLAFFAVKDDIANGLIECSEELKGLLDVNVDSSYISELGTKWTINIDGTSNPTVTLTWKNALLESEFDAIDSCSVILHVASDASSSFSPSSARHEFFNLGTYLYTSQPQSWVFDDLMLQGSNASQWKWTEKLDQFLTNVVKHIRGYCAFKMQLRYVINGDLYESTEMFAIFDSNGENTKVESITRNDGSTVVFTHNNTDDVYDEFEDDLDGDIDNSGSYGVSGLALLTKSYVMSVNDLKSLGNFLWSDDFTENIKLINNSPIENIVSCQAFPFAIETESSAPLFLGNVEVERLGSCPVIRSDYRSIYDVGTFTIPKKYNNWLDYEMTSVSIFLPYIGYRELDINECMGKQIKVKYLCDLIGGSCKAQISVNNIPTYEFGGQIGVNVPLTASNNTEVFVGQATSLLSASVGVMGSLSMGNVGGAISSGVSGLVGGLTKPHSFTSVGTCSSLVNSFDSHDCFLIIERPQVQYPKNYNHTFGKPCYLTCRLNNLQGFTQCANVDVNTIPCTDEERSMIKTYLETGVYL